MDSVVLNEISQSNQLLLQHLNADEDSSDDDILLALTLAKQCKRKRNRIQNYIPNVVDNYTDKEFRLHFRLSRQLFESVLGCFANSNMMREKRTGRPQTDCEKMLLASLWFFANTETHRQLADRFGVSESTIFHCIQKVTAWLVSVAKVFIRWPVGEKKNETVSAFNELNGMTGVIGAIDGSHFRINAPQVHQEDYVNRKSYHSVNMQAVVDAKSRFTDIYVGEPGSLHDARVLRRSPIFRKAENDVAKMFPNETYLLGDSAYPCLNWLITPFKDNGHLSRAERNFNFKLSRSRVKVEHAFGLLKGRFRRLTHLTQVQVESIPKVVTACCVLHNICFLQNPDEMDVPEFVDVSDGDMNENDRVDVIEEQRVLRGTTAILGKNKRQQLLVSMLE